MIIRSKAHLNLGHDKEAINDAISACELEEDGGDAYEHLTTLANDDSRRATIIARVKKELETTEHPGYWHRLLYSIYEETPNKAEALRHLLRSYKAEPDYPVLRAIYVELAEANLDEEAYNLSDQALKMSLETGEEEDDRLAIRLHRTLLLEHLGRAQEAIDTLTAMRAEMTDKNDVDLQKAYILFHEKRAEEAIQTMKQMDDSGKDDSYWGMMARMYLAAGNTECAWLCTELMRAQGAELLQTLYSYALVNDKEAVWKTMRERAESDRDDVSDDEEQELPELTDQEVELSISQTIDSPYEMACIFSLIHEKEKAIGYLTEALKKGFKSFRHIEVDTDLDNIRNEAAFISTVKMYRSLEEKERQEMREIYLEEFAK